jgi:hypothetical protein
MRRRASLAAAQPSSRAPSSNSARGRSIRGSPVRARTAGRATARLALSPATDRLGEAAHVHFVEHVGQILGDGKLIRIVESVDRVLGKHFAVVEADPFVCPFLQRCVEPFEQFRVDHRLEGQQNVGDQDMAGQE